MLPDLIKIEELRQAFIKGYRYKANYGILSTGVDHFYPLPKEYKTTFRQGILGEITVAYTNEIWEVRFSDNTIKGFSDWRDIFTFFRSFGAEGHIAIGKLVQSVNNDRALKP